MIRNILITRTLTALLVCTGGILGGCPTPDLSDPSPESPPSTELEDAGSDITDTNVQDAGTIAVLDAGEFASVTDAGWPVQTPPDGGEIVGLIDAGVAWDEDAGTALAPPRPYVWQDYLAGMSSDWLENPPECQDNDWFAKYLHYRNRFRGLNDPVEPGFVSFGLAQGQGLPANFREPNKDCVNSWSVVEDSGSCVANALENVRGSYKWGDATVYLGYYFAMLSTEFAVFEQLGFDTSDTVADLYYALMAFNRLDEAAEIPYGATPVRDGFFLRDDVNGDFWQTNDGAFRFPRTDDYDAYGCMLSDYHCGELDIADGQFISQDQVIGLVWGLSFVYHFIPETAVAGGIALKTEAQEMVHRLVSKLKGNDWKVIDPDGETPPAQWGGNAQGLSNQLAKAANRVVGNTFGVDDYRDALSQSVGAAGFAGLDATWSVQLWYNKGMAMELAAINNSWTPAHMADRSLDFNAPMYAYAHAVLNNLPLDSKVAAWMSSSALTNAPCGGPCLDTANCEVRQGWQGPNRWRNAPVNNGDRHIPEAEFNGLDYMLMHNLLFLYEEGNHAVQIAERVPATCADFVGLSQIIANGPSNNQVYDGFDACVATDEIYEFCGRPWSLWLRDAYEGKATIFTGEGKWACTPNDVCVITTAGEDGTSGTDLFLGTGAADEFDGQMGNDCIYGYGGPDILEGNDGVDEIHGGYGNDEIYGERSGVNIYGGPDVLFGGPGNDYLNGNLGADALWGGEGFDELEGGPGNDYLNGGEGDDVLRGEGDDDYLHGGPGNDELWGDSGDDLLYGKEGNDKLNGESGDDWIYGDEGNDFLRGGTGDDRVWGHGGDDLLCGNGGDDDLSGSHGDDTCLGGGLIGGGTDTEHSCESEASYSDCTESAFNDWTP